MQLRALVIKPARYARLQLVRFSLSLTEPRSSNLDLGMQQRGQGHLPRSRIEAKRTLKRGLNGSKEV